MWIWLSNLQMETDSGGKLQVTDAFVTVYLEITWVHKRLFFLKLLSKNVSLMNIGDNLFRSDQYAIQYKL
jgi:hypothetical protein